MDTVTTKTKLCTEGVIDQSLEEKEMSEKIYNPLEKIFVG